MTFLKYLGFTLLTIIFVNGCQQQSDNSSFEFRVPVTVTDVGVENVEEIVAATGTLRAPELIKLTVMTGGLLQIEKGDKGQLAEGDHVKAGDLIASITGEDVRLAAKLKLAKQRLEEAKRNLEATKALFERNVVSAKDLERDKTAYEDAKLEFETSIHSDNRNKIVSPIDGVILKLGRDDGQLMANGQLVNPGQVIAEIAPLESLIADIDLVGKDVSRIKPGLDARVHYYAWQDKKFTGQVLRLAPTIKEDTRTIKAEVRVENKDLLLKPGMFVEVSIIAEKRELVPVIPRQSLTLRGGRRVVFVLNGQRVEQRLVELGLGDTNKVEIRKGVNIGEKVVVLGIETLTDQMPVRVTDS